MGETRVRLPTAPTLQATLESALSGEVRFDAYTRHLFSTDAGMYAIEPLGVVFPEDAGEVQAAVQIAGEFQVPVLPRGGGTSLCGQTVGRAVVLDFSRHMHRILEIDPEARLARVEPGVVQDDLNRAAARHGLLFAPDTATGNRATLGGMIGNNSCGARSARYGMTIDHVETLDVILSDGSRARLGPVEPAEIARRAGSDTLEGRLYREIPPLIRENAQMIRDAVPPHWRRSGGYRLECLLPEAGPFNLAHLVVGSEGTLAVTTQATVRLVARPAEVVGLVGHFRSVREALEVAPVAMECGATTVELVDRMILDLARSSPVHGHLTEQLEGNPGAILWVEFYGHAPGQAAADLEELGERWRGDERVYALSTATRPDELKGFRELRKAGLGLLMSAGDGRERSLAFVEDTAVDPDRLPEYTDRFADILTAHGLRAGFYGHASAGCLHIRPFMDLTRPGAPETMREVAQAVLELVREFDGMNSSEHGDGLARGEFNEPFFGREFHELMRRMKGVFDPESRMNPGKKVDAPPMTEHLRDPSLPPASRLHTHFPFDPGEGMRGTANRCMRIGACRKSAGAGGTMCPSYMATRQEEHSTRGRANALVKALSTPDPARALSDPELHRILDLCLECKACRTECPLSVDMAAMKAEVLAQHQARHGVPLRSRIFGHIRTLNRMGSALAPLSNVPARSRALRALLDRWVGIDRRRPLPRFRRQSLQRWFAARGPRTRSADRPAPRGRILLLADCFTSYTEPEIGRAAVELLEKGGWEVRLEDGVCCGRALISKGLLKEARARHRRLVDRLAGGAREGIPIVGCEPSCLLTLTEELPELAQGDEDGTGPALEDARAVAGAARLVDDLLARALEEGSLRPAPDSKVAHHPILFHGHCHQKAGGAVEGSERVLQAISGERLEVLDAGCCGMAGSFGFEREHYELSMEIGDLRLFPALRGMDPGTLVAATGVSCRQQIAHGTGLTARHPVVLLHQAVEGA